MIFRTLFTYTLLLVLLDYFRGRKLRFVYEVRYNTTTGEMKTLSRRAEHMEEAEARG